MDTAHFVFELSKCEKSGHEWCWLYRLVPYKLDETGSWPVKSCDKIVHQLNGVGFEADGVHCGGSDHELLLHVPRLTVYLQDSLRRCAEEKALWEINISFRDELLSWRPASERAYKTLVNINFRKNAGTNKDDDASRWATYILFASLYEFLSASPVGYSVARVYAAWQRYNLIKPLADIETENETDRAIATEFAASYRELTSLLLDEANSDACYVLWAIRLPKDKTPPTLIRQRLRLSMFVRQCTDRGALAESPLPAPGCFENVARVGVDALDKLHQHFQGDGGNVTIQRFISDELLPQYALTEALNLTRLARFGKSKRQRWIEYVLDKVLSEERGRKASNRIGRILRHAFALSAVLSLVGSVLIFAAFDLFASHWRSLPLFAVMAFSVSIVPLGLTGLGLRNAITLSLPRVLGGITIGYFPLLVAQESWYLAVYASRHPKIWLFEWLIIAIIVEGYLYREVFPLVLERREAFWRSLKVFLWATVMSVTIGFWLCLLAAPISWQVEYEPRRVDPSQATSEQAAPDTPFSSFMLREKPSVAEGLGYRVEVPWLRVEFPTAALLTFAPVALLLGIILQILWEEKAVTASVWPSESR